MHLDHFAFFTVISTILNFTPSQCQQREHPLFFGLMPHTQKPQITFQLPLSASDHNNITLKVTTWAETNNNASFERTYPEYFVTRATSPKPDCMKM